MRRSGPILLLLLLAVPVRMYGQAAEGQTGSTGAAASSVVPVKLGESSTELTGPWKFHTGDDMAWAQPDFDDSGWKSIDLTKPVGWTKQGYPGYSGFA